MALAGESLELTPYQQQRRELSLGIGLALGLVIAEGTIAVPFGGIVVPAILREIQAFARKEFSHPTPPTDIIRYGSKEQTIIEKIKTAHHLGVYSPRTVTSETEGYTNLPWTPEALALLDQSLSQLPPSYYTLRHKPEIIILERKPGTDNPGAGGGYLPKQIFLDISEGFAPNEPFDDPFYHTSSNQLRGTVIHEYTHAAQDNRPDVLNDWTRTMGWNQTGPDSWSNPNPDTLPPIPNPEKNPKEDMAQSASIMLVNPNALRQLSQARFDFFTHHPFYAGWQAQLAPKT